MLKAENLIISAVIAVCLSVNAQASLQADPSEENLARVPTAVVPTETTHTDPVTATPEANKPTIGQAVKDLGTALKTESAPARQAIKEAAKEAKPAVKEATQETKIVGKKAEKEVRRGLVKLGLKKKKGK